jgi:uncharacterized DUF497 family protein
MALRSRTPSGSSKAPHLSGSTIEYEYGEVRVYAIGIVNGVEITVIYTEVSRAERRIISAWKAERHEREAYWDSLA